MPRRIGVVLCALLAGPVSAEADGLGVAVLEACLAEAAVAEACIGRAAAVCAAAEGRQGGVGPCYGMEAAYWEARIDQAMVALAPAGAAAEAFAARVDWPQPRPSLAAVAAGFEAYREASCAMAGALWGGGSGAGPAWMACRMELAAAHALRLEAWGRIE